MINSAEITIDLLVNKARMAQKFRKMVQELLI